MAKQGPGLIYIGYLWVLNVIRTHVSKVKSWFENFGRDELLKLPSEIRYYKEACLNRVFTFLLHHGLVLLPPNEKWPLCFWLDSWFHQTGHLHTKDLGEHYRQERGAHLDSTIRNSRCICCMYIEIANRRNSHRVTEACWCGMNHTQFTIMHQ